MLDVSTSSGTERVLDIPAGLICRSADGKSAAVVLVGARVALSREGNTQVALPAALLSSQRPMEDQSWIPVAETRPELKPLLDFLGGKPDVPRLTSQLAVLALTEDVSFAKWRAFLAARQDANVENPPPPTPAEVVQAVDALGILRTLWPERRFALMEDAQLKRLALRNPWARGKAMTLYGLTLDNAAADAAAPPDLGQLLHSSAGDNCPTCRQRARMQEALNGGP
jgi:hypothetical protein